ncbi:MAG: hypothetical protein IJS39_08760 [Synergistaceae bacterium]|nr:hypothetical protein [Synergistaceae bacterium]
MTTVDDKQAEIRTGGGARKLVVSGLRKVKADGWTRLTADIEFVNVPEAEEFKERTLWAGVEDKNEYMLADDVYDAFVLVPLYMAMYYKADLYIRGFVSRTLFRNADMYFQGILRDFSDDLSRVEVHAEGFREAEGNPEIVGTGFSCGVDSLSTVYDHYVREDIPEYRISGLFMLNCGWHGNYYNSASRNMFVERCRENRKAAEELGLPMYMVDSNFHAFTYGVLGGANDKLGYIAIYSCILALERAVRRYYFSSGFSYGDTITYGHTKHDLNFDGFASPYAVPLASTEKLCFVMDGCQNVRWEKVRDIADWDIAQKYLNVCLGDSHIFTKSGSAEHENAANCSECEKCMRTQLALEALGKLQLFSGVFDMDTYRRKQFGYKCEVVAKKNSNYTKAWLLMQTYRLCRQKGIKLPTMLTARAYLFAVSLPSLPRKIFRRAKRILHRLTGH